MRGRIQVRPTDRFVASYPRSGNTWVRFLIGNLLDPSTPTDFNNVEQRVPDMYLATRRDLDSMRDRRIMKTHEPWDRRFNGVYLVRDPRQVATSYFRYSRKRRLIDESVSLGAFCEGFVEGRTDTFGTWAHHVESWMDAKPAQLIVRYEDLVADTGSVLERIAAFLDLTVDNGAIERSIEWSSMDAMVEAESRSGSRVAWMSWSDESIPFVGGGTQSADELTTELEELIIARFGSTMDRCGYPTSGTG